MTITIKNVGNGGGWGEYVLGKNEVRPGATTILGDAQLGDEISKSIEYKSGNSVNFVISFADEDNVNTDQGREIAQEFMKEFMKGYSEDEYHLDMVEHTDTHHLHYHARVPKLNLLTNTQLKLYWHKTDLGYKKAIIDDICHRHKLVTGQEMKKTIPNPVRNLNQISKWRDSHGQEPLNLKTPKLRRVAEQELGEHISNMNTLGSINSLADVKAELKEMGLQVTNEGYDKSKEFHYLTVENDSGKMRIKGEIYNGRFYGHNKEDREESISNNRSFIGRREELESSGEELKQTLQREYGKRAKFIEKQYGNARKRANQQPADQNQSQTMDNTNSHGRVDSSRSSLGNVGSYEVRHKRTDDTCSSRKRTDRSNEKERSTGESSSNKQDLRQRHRVAEEAERVAERQRQLDSSIRERQRAINDSIRTKINDSIRDAGRSFFERVAKDSDSLQSTDERSFGNNREVSGSIGKIQKFRNALSNRANEIFGNIIQQAGELELRRPELIAEIGQHIKTVIKEVKSHLFVKEVAESNAKAREESRSHSYDSGPTMSR